MGWGKDCKIVAWKKAGFGKQCIEQYGPPNAAKYRLQSVSKAGAPLLENSFNFGSTDSGGQRREEQKSSGTYSYTYKDILGVDGVAWKETAKTLESADFSLSQSEARR